MRQCLIHKTDSQETLNYIFSSCPGSSACVTLIPKPTALKTHFLYANCQPANGQIYTDPTGRFLVPSVSGNSYILDVYDYNGNFIHAEPMKDRTKEVILAAYQRVISLLKSCGLLPKLQKLDNEASQVLQQYMVEEHIDFQLVPPGLHRQRSRARNSDIQKLFYYRIMHYGSRLPSHSVGPTPATSAHDVECSTHIAHQPTLIGLVPSPCNFRF